MVNTNFLNKIDEDVKHNRFLRFGISSSLPTDASKITAEERKEIFSRAHKATLEAINLRHMRPLKDLLAELNYCVSTYGEDISARALIKQRDYADYTITMRVLKEMLCKTQPTTKKEANQYAELMELFAKNGMNPLDASPSGDTIYMDILRVDDRLREQYSSPMNKVLKAMQWPNGLAEPLTKALYQALEAGDTISPSKLVRAGAKPNLTLWDSSRRNIFHCTSYALETDVANDIISAFVKKEPQIGASLIKQALNAQFDDQGNLPTHALLLTALEHKNDPKTRDKAAKLMKSYIAQGADLTKENRAGQTVRDLARQLGDDFIPKGSGSFISRLRGSDPGRSFVR